ncbi:hypothetical protein [Nocardiopsis synnemataformans]|uniref:hypothetical protein n=1 Tax=Nocardiopsis synnemataformans TaxID=61305 RepID=UPI003EC0D73F
MGRTVTLSLLGLNKLGKPLAAAAKNVSQLEKRLETFNARTAKAMNRTEKSIGNLDRRINAFGQSASIALKPTAILSAASAVTALGAAVGPASGALLALPAAAGAAGAAAATLAVGLSGVGEAMKAVADEDAEALAEALEDLSPAAREFVRSWQGIREGFEPVREAVQEELFSGLGEDLKSLAKESAPELESGMSAVAASLNGVAKEAMAAAGTELFRGQMADIFTETATATDSFGKVVPPLITVLGELVKAGLPMVTAFNEWAAGGLEAAAAWLTTEEGAAKMEGAVAKASEVLGQLSRIAGNLGGGLGGVFGAASADGESLLDTIEQLTQRFDTWANSTSGQEDLATAFELLVGIAEDLLSILPGIADVIGQIADAFNSLSPETQAAVTQFLAWSILLAPLLGKVTGLLTGVFGLVRGVGVLAGGMLGVVGGTAGFIGGLVKGSDALGENASRASRAGAALRTFGSSVASGIKGIGQFVGTLGMVAWEYTKIAAKALAAKAAQAGSAIWTGVKTVGSFAANLGKTALEYGKIAVEAARAKAVQAGQAIMTGASKVGEFATQVGKTAMEYGRVARESAKAKAAQAGQAIMTGASKVGEFATQVGKTATEYGRVAIEATKAKAAQAGSAMANGARSAAAFAANLGRVSLEYGKVAVKATAAKVALIAQKVAQVAITVATRTWTAVQWLLNVAMSANPIGLIIAGVLLLVGAILLAWRHSETFRAVVTAAWEGIKLAILWAWENGIKPALMALVGFWQNTLQPAVMNLWHGVIQPAFSAIGAVISWVFNKVIMPVIRLYIAYVQNVLVPVVLWLWNNVIAPAFRGIGAAISWAWNSIIKPAFSAINAFISNVLGPIFRWLWNNVIVPAWNGIKATISTVWNSGIKPAFNAVKEAVGKVAGAFETAKDAIKTAWQKVKSAAGAPIKFVIDTVYNKGIVAVWNKVAEKVPGISEIDKMSIPRGLARGGVLPGYSTYHQGDDQLVPMRRGEGVYVAEAMKDPRERARLFAVNRAAMAGKSLDQFHEPGFSRGGILGAVSGFLSGAADNFRDGFYSIAKGTLNPFVDRTREAVGSTGFGGMAVDVVSHFVGKILDKFKPLDALLTGGNADKVINLASSKIGNFGGNDANNEFTRAFGMSGLPWCAMFVSKIFKDAGAKGAINDTWSAAVATFNSRMTKVPKSSARDGDLATYRGNGHINIVSDAARKQTIGGNESNRVRKQTGYMNSATAILRSKWNGYARGGVLGILDQDRRENALAHTPGLTRALREGVGLGLTWPTARALGGQVHPGHTYKVGERGPEYLTMGSRAHITPAGEGGTTYQIHVTVGPGGNPAEVGKAVVESIQAYEKRSGKRWRS